MNHEFLLAHVRWLGCSCEPEFSITGAGRLEVAHDEDCVLLLEMTVDEALRLTVYGPDAPAST